jgi:hypothetical protein
MPHVGLVILQARKHHCYQSFGPATVIMCHVPMPHPSSSPSTANIAPHPTCTHTSAYSPPPLYPIPCTAPVQVNNIKQQIHNRCHYCQGAGYLTCGHCVGGGQEPGSTETCSFCAGSGKVMCTGCLCTGKQMATEHDPRIDPFT